jgi:hypothetical protein
MAALSAWLTQAPQKAYSFFPSLQDKSLPNESQRRQTRRNTSTSMELFEEKPRLEILSVIAS